ncbi:MAG: DUF2795 domain-containing protein [Chitinivibrionales bacterium]|nr:DUF2795 domain-containing protein [Chitinivibrionales bacterium]
MKHGLSCGGRVAPRSPDNRRSRIIRPKEYPMAIMANPVELEHFLEKVSFPASKGQLLDFAHQNHAQAPMLVSLEQLPDRDYQNAADVAKSAWTSEEMGHGEVGGADSPDDE